jgi:O-antigen ligase
MFNIFVGDQVDSSTQTRLDMIIFGLREFSKKPFLGYGIDNFRVLYGGFMHLLMRIIILSNC